MFERSRQSIGTDIDSARRSVRQCVYPIVNLSQFVNRTGVAVTAIVRPSQ